MSSRIPLLTIIIGANVISTCNDIPNDGIPTRKSLLKHVTTIPKSDKLKSLKRKRGRPKRRRKLSVAQEIKKENRQLAKKLKRARLAYANKNTGRAKRKKIE